MPVGYRYHTISYQWFDQRQILVQYLSCLLMIVMFFDGH